MNAKDVLRLDLKANHAILTNYLSDLSDADLLVRPAPGANHIAWQLGHLIVAEGRAFAQSQGEGHGTTVVLELPRVAPEKLA